MRSVLGISTLGTLTAIKLSNTSRIKILDINLKAFKAGFDA